MKVIYLWTELYECYSTNSSNDQALGRSERHHDFGINKCDGTLKHSTYEAMTSTVLSVKTCMGCYFGCSQDIKG